MKTFTFFALFLSLNLTLSHSAQGQTRGIVWEYQIITAVESVIPGGLGRSRLLFSDDRGVLEEYKMENFFSLIGINFKNIKANDLLVVQKFNELGEEGWELNQTVSGVYSKSDINVTDSKNWSGCFLKWRRYFYNPIYFQKTKK